MIKEFGLEKGFHASMYNAIAYNIMKTGNCSSPNLDFWLQKCS